VDSTKSSAADILLEPFYARLFAGVLSNTARIFSIAPLASACRSTLFPIATLKSGILLAAGASLPGFCSLIAIGGNEVAAFAARLLGMMAFRAAN
jgi:hypothetical protein